MKSPMSPANDAFLIYEMRTDRAVPPVKSLLLKAYDNTMRPSDNKLQLIEFEKADDRISIEQ